MSFLLFFALLSWAILSEASSACSLSLALLVRLNVNGSVT